MQPLSPLPDATEVGTLGIYRLKRLWAGMQAQQRGQPFPRTRHDRHLDHIVTDAVGLGLEQVLDGAEFRGIRALDRCHDRRSGARAGRAP